MAHALPNSLAATAEPSSRGIMYAAFCVVILLQHTYLFTFNEMPSLRLPLSSAIAGLHVVLAGLTILLRPAPWNMPLLLAAAVLVAAVIPAQLMGYGEVRGFDPVMLLRKLVLPLMMIWVLSFPLALPRSLLAWVAAIGTLLCAYVAFTGPTIYMGYNYTDPRLAAFTGGDEHIHPSSKYMALQFVLIDLLRRGGFMPPRIAWPLMALTIVVLLGYGGRNQLVFIAVYFLMLAYYRLRNVTAVRWSPPLLLALAICAIVIALQIGENTHDWGSGRIGVWWYRLQLMQNRDLITLFFGGGLGADSIWTPQWSYSDEGMSAHNDYLHYMMEHGVLGLVFVALMILGLWLRLFEEGRAIIVAVLVNSMISNGFLLTPLLATSLVLMLSLSILVSLQRKGVLAIGNQPQ
jgi:hypothetical protein